MASRAATAALGRPSIPFRRRPGAAIKNVSLRQAELTRWGLFVYNCIVLLVLAAVAWAYYYLGGGYTSDHNLVPQQVRGLPIRCMWLGALGGIVISLKGLYDYGADAWQTRFTIWHLGRPFSGAIAGGITYLLLLAVSGSTPSTPVVMAAAFVLGTQEKRFFNFLFEVARLVVQVPGEASERPLEVKEIRPLAAASGSTVTILGEGFDPGVTVLFNDKKLQDTVVSRDGTTVTGTVPELVEDSETARIVVYNPTGAAFVGTSMLFTYLPNPSPKKLHFGAQPIGQRREERVQLRNVTATPMKVQSVEVKDNPGDFDAPQMDKPVVLLRDQEYVIPVGFTPRQAGERSATLIIKADTRSFEVQLSGTGTGQTTASTPDDGTGASNTPAPTAPPRP